MDKLQGTKFNQQISYTGQAGASGKNKSTLNVFGKDSVVKSNPKDENKELDKGLWRKLGGGLKKAGKKTLNAAGTAVGVVGTAALMVGAGMLYIGSGALYIGGVAVVGGAIVHEAADKIGGEKVGNGIAKIGKKMGMKPEEAGRLGKIFGSATVATGVATGVAAGAAALLGGPVGLVAFLAGQLTLGMTAIGGSFRVAADSLQK